METIINPYRDLPARITPAEFEIFCMETLKAVAEKQNLSDFTIKQNQRIETFDGTYQIDVLAEYKVFNCRNIMVVECKKHNKSIERKYVAELYTKVQSIGAQKGLLISTSGFQSDAVKFAGVHGLSLWQICGKEIKHIYASGSETPPSFIVFQLEMEKHLPKYITMEWDCDRDYPCQELYPTEEMYDYARKKVRETMMNDRRGENV